MCSATQGRRAAKWGQAADSLPKWVRTRRPVTLGGGGNPFTPNQRLAVTPWRGAPSSRHEPPRAARRRALGQAAATAASAAPPPPRPLHRRRFSARMVAALAISCSPSARPSQRARPKNRHRARVRGGAASASHAESHLCVCGGCKQSLGRTPQPVQYAPSPLEGLPDNCARRAFRS